MLLHKQIQNVDTFHTPHIRKAGTEGIFKWDRYENSGNIVNKVDHWKGVEIKRELASGAELCVCVRIAKPFLAYNVFHSML